ncbi:MAG: fumarylacetoacetate hydrolase family protein [Alphaproteobacteria bacterium]|nr:fumarylacetoacetate hydrolase family protein [Alphaproteobacteria bacterium]
MGFVIPPPPQPAVLVAASSSSFPVRRIWCVGRNYAAHAREMGGDPNREPPFFFAKPSDAVVMTESTLPYPPATENLHHEVELVVALKSGGINLSPEAALDCVFGYAVGIDLTRRDLQEQAKKAGRPWEIGKGFDASAPIGLIHPVSEIGHPASGAIRLMVNGQLRQSGDLSDMIWSVGDVLAHLSKLVRLEAGDLIYTGTPEGVGPLLPGDVVTGEIEGVGGLKITIGS